MRLQAGGPAGSRAGLAGLAAQSGGAAVADAARLRTHRSRHGAGARVGRRRRHPPRPDRDRARAAVAQSSAIGNGCAAATAPAEWTHGCLALRRARRVSARPSSCRSCSGLPRRRASVRVASRSCSSCWHPTAARCRPRRTCAVSGQRPTPRCERSCAPATRATRGPTTHGPPRPLTAYGHEPPGRTSRDEGQRRSQKGTDARRGTSSRNIKGGGNHTSSLSTCPFFTPARRSTKHLDSTFRER